MRDINRLLNSARRLGSFSPAHQVDRAIHRTITGRIVNFMSFIFIALCGGGFALTVAGAYALKLNERLPQGSLGVLGVVLVCSFLLVIILAGVVGEVVRRLIWRFIPRRWFRF
jgi:hypothetical protein